MKVASDGCTTGFGGSKKAEQEINVYTWQSGSGHWMRRRQRDTNACSFTDDPSNIQPVMAGTTGNEALLSWGIFALHSKVLLQNSADVPKSPLI